MSTVGLSPSALAGSRYTSSSSTNTDAVVLGAVDVVTGSESAEPAELIEPVDPSLSPQPTRAMTATSNIAAAIAERISESPGLGS